MPKFKPDQPAANIDEMDDAAFYEHLTQLVSLADSLRQRYHKRVNAMRQHYEDAARLLLRMDGGEAKATERHF